MYADRYSAGPTIKPGSLSLALAATALPLAALILGLQIKQALIHDAPIATYAVPEEKPKPVDPRPLTKPDDRPAPHETLTVPVRPPVPSDNDTVVTLGPPQPPIDTPPQPLPPDTGTALTPVQSPVIVGAQVDPRYAGLLQPPYPPEERRAGRAGRVVLKVLIGPDGRVRQVERVAAASDAFYTAAERQALSKWRFKPATRDGIAIEQWKTMSIRFEMTDE